MNNGGKKYHLVIYRKWLNCSLIDSRQDRLQSCETIVLCCTNMNQDQRQRNDSRVRQLHKNGSMVSSKDHRFQIQQKTDRNKSIAVRRHDVKYPEHRERYSILDSTKNKGINGYFPKFSRNFYLKNTKYVLVYTGETCKIKYFPRMLMFFRFVKMLKSLLCRLRNIAKLNIYLYKNIRIQQLQLARSLQIQKRRKTEQTQHQHTN